jgi:primosomal protein N'
MFVIEVIPLKRGISIESLTYYSAVSYKPGTLLSIPLRNGETTAVVVDFKPVSAAKTALKTATFSLRKLPVQDEAPALPEALINTVHKVSERVPASIGSILFALLPPDIRDGVRLYPKTIETRGTEDATPRILTETTVNRFIAYKSEIRASFAHRGSVLFIVPTSISVEQVRKKLELGIENRVVTFSSTLSKTQLAKSYEAFDDLRQAKLIIATPSYAFLDRHDITTIIVEDSGNGQYLQRTRPYLDVREVLKQYAKECGRSILLGDAIPLTEDEIKRQDDRYITYAEHTQRLQYPSVLTLAPHPKLETGEEFSLCTQQLKEVLDLTYAKQGHVFLHCARKGLAPAVICYDCGYIFRCPDSGAPYSLLRTFKGEVEERWFLSGTSGKRVRAADVCPSCGSWRLREQGIGIQQVYDTMKKLFPSVELFVFDHTTATTFAKARKIMSSFYAAKKGMLLGTNMALSYLEDTVDVSAIMSYEATRALPTWRADETIFSLLLALREHTSKDVIVQLRTEPDELLQFAARGLIDQFYENEIAVRKALAYPPYSVFILLSWMGTKEQTHSIEEIVQKSLEDLDVQYYSAPQSSASKTMRYGLIRINAQKWPEKDTMEKLRALPPFIKIEVNPDKIV